jgi:beta-glucosidase/6-phospho-beta-glucosidase/beta-galactosidase
MPEDDEILKNGTVDFVSISYYSSNCVSVTQKGKITAANGGENIKNPLKSVYLIATRDLSNLWLQFFLSQNQGFMRLFEKTVLK